MNLLLDTHILLWWLDDHPSLSATAKSAIANGNNTVFISTVSLWEIRIKQAIGKLDIPANFKEIVDKEPMQYLPLKAEHAYEIINLPMYHRDPFDRMLISQARLERLTLVTSDQHFNNYDVRLLAGS